MAAAKDSTADMTEVFVRLLGEGTLVYRPAPATPVGVDTVRLSAPQGYDPEDEEWEFPPGSVVLVARRTLKGGEVLVAVSAAPRTS